MLERLDRLLGFRWLYTRYRQFGTGGVFLNVRLTKSNGTKEELTPCRWEEGTT